MKDGQRSLHFRSSENKEITDLRMLGWPIQIYGTFWNILKSRIISIYTVYVCMYDLSFMYHLPRVDVRQNETTMRQELDNNPEKQSADICKSMVDVTEFMCL